MTEQTTTTEQHTDQEVDWAAARARLDQQFRESVQRTSLVQNAWDSAEAKAVREVVQADGNVNWREFVSHCGGILNACDLVDADGRADTRRIIPLVDELFAKDASKEFAGGVTYTRKPGNRPYIHSKALTAERVPFPGDRDYREHDAEELLRREQETAHSRPPARR